MKDLICDLIILIAVLIIAVGAAIWSAAESWKYRPRTTPSPQKQHQT